jgi:hypothetical protein
MAVSPFNRGVSIVDAEDEPASYNGKTDTRDGFSLTVADFAHRLRSRDQRADTGEPARQ